MRSLHIPAASLLSTIPKNCLNLFVDDNLDMKRFLYLVLLFNLSAYSQGYVPFPEKDFTWHTHRSVWNNPAFDEYYCIGDTIRINDTLYSEIYFTMVSPEGILLVNNRLVWYLRQDTAQKKVYIKPDATGAEVLLYDFDIRVGDTLKIPTGLDSVNWTYGVLDNIDTIDYGSTPRRRYRLHNECIEFNWIEGIGCECSPFFFDYCLTDTYFELFGTYDSCICDMSYLDIIILESEMISIFPNPISRPLNLSVSNNGNNIRTIRIFSIDGVELFSQLTADTCIHLDETIFKRGVYFLLISTDKGQISIEKLIIY